METLMRFLRCLISIGLWCLAVLTLVGALTVDPSNIVMWGLMLAAAWAAAGVWPTGRDKDREVGALDNDIERLTASLEQRQKTRRAPKVWNKHPRVRWYKEHEAVKTNRIKFPGGMIYFGTDAPGEPFRSTIDPALPIARNRPDVDGHSMPYWPSYTEISPHERLAYLDWLSGGRTGGAYIGYVFLFFYGLERRAFVDRVEADFPLLQNEVKRLLTLYRENRSFSNYAARFLDTVDGLIALTNDFPAELPIIEDLPTDWEFPLMARVAIGKKLQYTSHLDGAWMFVWHSLHPETRFRVPAQRAFSLYKKLFITRFNKKYPNGLKITLPKKKISVCYQSASSDFEANISTDLFDVADLKRPWRIADEVAEQCQEDLSPYSRFIGRQPIAKDSLQATALLPTELSHVVRTRSGEALRDWLDAKIQETFGLVVASELLDQLELDAGAGKRISKAVMRQSKEILSAFNFGIEPDPNRSGYLAALDEPLVLFRLPKNQDADFGEAFLFASLAATLSVGVANADDVVDQAEFQLITNSIARNPHLTDLERLHLKAWVLWLLEVPPSLPKLKSSLSGLQHTQKERLADITLEISLADGKIDPSEVKLLEKVYKLLGLNADEIYSTLHTAQSKSSAANTPISVRPATPVVDHTIPDRPQVKPRKTIQLDGNAVERIRAETTIVSAVLSDVFQSEDDTLIEVNNVIDEERGAFEGLDKRHAALLKALLDRGQWSRDEFEGLCKTFKLLPEGVMETLNEWAYDTFDDPILEEDESINVQQYLLEQAGTAA